MLDVTRSPQSRVVKRQVAYEQHVEEVKGDEKVGVLGSTGASRTDAETIKAPIASESPASLQSIAEGKLFLERSRQLEADAKRKFWELMEGIKSITLEAEACRGKIRADVQQQAHDHVENFSAEAQQVLADAESLAQSMKCEAEAYRDKVIADVQRKARDYRDKVKADVQRKARDYLAKCTAKAQQVLSDAELLRAQVREELETQKKLTEAAKLKVESPELLAQIRG